MSHWLTPTYNMVLLSQPNLQYWSSCLPSESRSDKNQNINKNVGTFGIEREVGPDGTVGTVGAGIEALDLILCGDIQMDHVHSERKF